MSSPSFQNEVARFTARHNLEIRVQDRTLDLMSEVGELAKEILKASHYGREAFEAGDSWRDELGDVFFSLVCLANSTEVDLVAALEEAMAKYQARLAGGGDAGSG